MTPHLTICYQTCRADPKIEWFFDSLKREISSLGESSPIITVVVVSFFVLDYPWLQPGMFLHDLKVVPPKPNVWQGPHRLTRQNYFAAANSRNTGLCLAPDGWIAYVDDLSVLIPGWLKCVSEAMQGDYIMLGAYKKVKKLVVEDGVAKSWEEFPEGVDTRWSHGANEPVPAPASFLFGCSFASTVEALLTVGGHPEYVDSLGGEDYCLGIALENNGFKLKYDRRALTLESYEHHYDGKQFKRTDKGVSPHDKSHAALRQAENSRYFENYYSGGIRALRQHVLNGGQFPTDKVPQHDWFDGQLISEM